MVSTATHYFPLVGGGVGTTGESFHQILVRDTYTCKNLWARVITNTTSTSSTIRTRKNAANGAQSVTFSAAETGTKEDTVNTEAVADGELWNYQLVTGFGAVTVSIISTLLEHSGTGNFILASTGATSQNESATNFFGIGGRRVNEVEASVQYTFRKVFRISNLRIYVSANTSTGTVRVRKNGANGNQSASIAANATGSFEDTANGDTIVGGNPDAVAFVLTTTSDMGTLTSQITQVEAQETGGPIGQQLLSWGAISLSADAYMGFSSGDSSATELNSQMKARTALTISNMYAYVVTNATTVADIYFRQNGANAGPTVNYGSGVTGAKEDTVNSVTLADTDLINFFVDITSGSLIAPRVGVEAQQVAEVTLPPNLVVVRQAVNRSAVI